MKCRFPIVLTLLLSLLPSLPGEILAQEIKMDTLLIRRKSAYLTYMPVIGAAVGTMHFFGDVQNSYPTPLSDKMGFMFNLSSPPFDRNKSLLVNFSILFGEITGNERSHMDLERNLNFQSTIKAFEIGLEYNFGHLFRKPDPVLQPFLSIGFGSFLFKAKGDLRRGNEPYHYWSDGTIRNMPELGETYPGGEVMMRDWEYETDLRDADMYGLGAYRQSSFTIPMDVGLDFNFSKRMKMRMGTQYHLTFTDLIDNVSWEGEGNIGDKAMDHFAFTYIGLHLDLFTGIRDDRDGYLADAWDEIDYQMFDDEDGDGVVDWYDDCEETPYGVAVDSTGCPLDTDLDGVPDYRDDEISPKGAFVNDSGVELSNEELENLLIPPAVRRSELGISYIVPRPRRERMTFAQLDEKLHVLDLDGDQYLSYEELLLAINDFFDQNSFMTTDEIYELINFFFAQ